MESKIYRVRKGFNNTSVLQVLVNSPSFNGGVVDSSIRSLNWCDVSYNKAPIVLTAICPKGE